MFFTFFHLIGLQPQNVICTESMYVLVLAGIELIFFTVASMGLCFGFELETVLITGIF